MRRLKCWFFGHKRVFHASQYNMICRRCVNCNHCFVTVIR